MRDRLHQYTGALANDPKRGRPAGCTMTLAQFGVELNRAGIRTSYGGLYSEEGGVGLGRVVSCGWKYFHDRGDDTTAANIANFFRNCLGKRACWKREHGDALEPE